MWLDIICEMFVDMTLQIRIEYFGKHFTVKTEEKPIVNNAKDIFKEEEKHQVLKENNVRINLKIVERHLGI